MIPSATAIEATAWISSDRDSRARSMSSALSSSASERGAAASSAGRDRTS